MSRIISVDIESDGPIPGMYSILSIGAVDILYPTRTFYRELQPISDSYIPEALDVAGLSLAVPGANPVEKRQNLFKMGIPAMQATFDFDAWLPEKPVFCSFSTWDWSFIYWYFIKYLGRSPFGHSSLDMKSYYMAWSGSFSWRDTTKGRIAKDHPELLEGLGPHTHNALDDAIEQGEFFRRMYEVPTQ